MKKVSNLVAALLLVFTFSQVNAQTENLPWAFTAGVNAVDLYPVGEDAPRGDYFDEYFNVSDHWNILPSISKLTLSRYLSDGFVASVSGSANKIDKFPDRGFEDSDLEADPSLVGVQPRNSELTYVSLEGLISYNFRDLINGEGGWFAPYLGVGGGYTWLDDIGAGNLNGAAGIDFMISENFAINAQSTYKHAFEDYGVRHFQHSLGAKFIFGGVDTDGDGIYDDEDACPETPGLPQFNGCPDTDLDGIQDSEDACPTTFGLPEFNGCPDTDGDGIADPNDACPNEAGPAYNNGCPDPDTDGDGIVDSKDGCPNEAGPAENNGCPYNDRDNDGVLDKDDQCPDTPGTVANNGCPEVTAEIINQLNEFSRTILFDLNKATIRQESYGTMQSIANIMKEYPNASFLIEGHTDSSGSDAYNQNLSEQRAASVRTYLGGLGIDSSRLQSRGFGESRPIATNKTKAGRQQNRRVDVSLISNN